MLFFVVVVSMNFVPHTSCIMGRGYIVFRKILALRLETAIASPYAKENCCMTTSRPSGHVEHSVPVAPHKSKWPALLAPLANVAISKVKTITPLPESLSGVMAQKGVVSNCRTHYVLRVLLVSASPATHSSSPQ